MKLRDLASIEIHKRRSAPGQRLVTGAASILLRDVDDRLPYEFWTRPDSALDFMTVATEQIEINTNNARLSQCTMFRRRRQKNQQQRMRRITTIVQSMAHIPLS